MKLSLRNPFKKKNVIPFSGSKYVIKYAFTVEGIKYYCMDDTFNLPYLRGLKCVTFYEEMRMNCDRALLIAHTEAVNNILTGSKIDIYEIKKLNDQMLDRLTHIVDTDLVYKLASVVFFDESENPADYEFQYNAKKIEHWKKHQDLTAFFLSTPIQKLVPFLKEFKENLPAYAQATKQIKNLHSEMIGGHLSKEQKKTFFTSKA